jgi:hypothetical protein
MLTISGKPEEGVTLITCLPSVKWKTRNSAIPAGVSRLFNSSSILQGRRQDQGHQLWNSSKEIVMIDLFLVSLSFLCSPSLKGQGESSETHPLPQHLPW